MLSTPQRETQASVSGVYNCIASCMRSPKRLIVSSECLHCKKSQYVTGQ